MEATTLVDTTAPSRELIRKLRTGAHSAAPEAAAMPESIAWHVYLELRRRGEDRAHRAFIGALKSLHSRRSIAGVALPSDDCHPDEHRMVDDPFLADLWKAYKKCIANNRTGPAAQLLRDIEEQLDK